MHFKLEAGLRLAHQGLFKMRMLLLYGLAGSKPEPNATRCAARGASRFGVSGALMAPVVGPRLRLAISNTIISDSMIN